MPRRTLISAALALELCAPMAALAQIPVGTAFTYQGQLTDAGNPATGSFDFQFQLFDSAAGGSQLGSTADRPGVVVAAGLFTVSLDFGQSPFAGEARWLQILVRPAGGGAYTPIAPRTPLTPAPYALLAEQVVDGPGSGLDADFVDGLNSTQLLRSDTSGVLTGTLTVDSAGAANAVMSEAGIDRNLAGPTTFTVQNSDAGAGSTMQLQVESGTAPGAPAYSFLGDTDTGIFHPAADTVAVAAGGTQMATIDTSGLHVVKTTLGGAAIEGTGPGSVIGDGILGRTGTGGRGVVAQNTSSGTALMTVSASGNQLLAITSLSFPDPVLRVSNAGSVLAEGTLTAGYAVTGVETPPSYNSFGNPANKDEATISAANDVYVEGGLEIDGNAFVGLKARMTSLQVTGGAMPGQVLTSDAAGNATWQPPAGVQCNRTCSTGGNVQTIFQIDITGACVAAFRIPCFPYKCGASALCRDICSSDADCAPGATCDIALNACAPHGQVCQDDFTIEDANGQIETCIPYKCVGGGCQQQCQNTNDCFTGYTCVNGRCQ